MWLWCLCLMVACVVEIQSHRSKSKSNKSVDIKAVVLACQAGFCAGRLVWFLNPSPTTTIIGTHLWQTLPVSGLVINALLIKLPQLLLLVSPILLCSSLLSKNETHRDKREAVL